MGNQLVGAAPAQIFPVEHYLSDITDLDFDANLGSTRFLKVAKAKHHSGLVVVKVFTIQDAGLTLKEDRDKLTRIKNVLEGSVNCLPFHQAFVSFPVKTQWQFLFCFWKVFFLSNRNGNNLF